jgi:antitoxin HigA-1
MSTKTTITNKTMKKRSAKVPAGPVLEKITGGPITFGKLLESIRITEEWSMAELAVKLGITRSQVNDIEKGRKAVSIERAARFAEALGFSPVRFVTLALQSQLDQAGLNYRVDLSA